MGACLFRLTLDFNLRDFQDSRGVKASQDPTALAAQAEEDEAL